jgi:hypothetical protein
MFLANLRFIVAICIIANLCAAQSASTKFPGFVQVNDKLKVYYKLVKTASGEDALSIKAVYQGLAWLGIGLSLDGEMIGGEAIIGKPDAAVSSSNPGKYTMSAESISGVKLRDPSAQTLIDGSISQDSKAGTTTLEFTKILQEYYELMISTVGINTFIYAIGSDNTYPSYHGGGRGSFEVDLSTQSASGTSMTTASPSPNAATISGSSGTLPPTVTKAPVALVGVSGTATPTYFRYKSTLYPTSSSLSPVPTPVVGTRTPTVTKVPTGISLTSASGSTSSPSLSGSNYYKTSDGSGDRYFGTENI